MKKDAFMLRCFLLLTNIAFTFCITSCKDSVQPENLPLIANAGLDQITIAGSYAIFDPTKSKGDFNWYEWKQDENNPEKINIYSDNKQIKDEWNIHKIAFVKEGIYKFILTVKSGVTTRMPDGTNTSMPDTLVITVNPNQNSKFEDPNLEAIIRAKLNKQVEYLDENTLLSLDTLSVAEVIPVQEISSLKGIEHCKNLTYLGMSSENISDISPIASLTSLKILELDQNYKISDITPLKDLFSLEVLNLNDNLITNISSIKALVKLKKLDLQYNKVQDISGLQNLTELNELRFCGGSFSDIKPLEGLLKINLLWLTNCNISDITPIKKLIEISNLHLAWNQITDITPLKNLEKLEWVALDKNNITDISSLKNLQNLGYIRLWYNQISDIKPLIDNSGIGKDDVIGLDGNPLDDKSLNEYIPALQTRGVSVTW
jgi:Leucine-rich repeat (LRR) protein